jgi:hypothetical protein
VLRWQRRHLFILAVLARCNKTLPESHEDQQNSDGIASTKPTKATGPHCKDFRSSLYRIVQRRSESSDCVTVVVRSVVHTQWQRHEPAAPGAWHCVSARQLSAHTRTGSPRGLQSEESASLTHVNQRVRTKSVLPPSQTWMGRSLRERNCTVKSERQLVGRLLRCVLCLAATSSSTLNPASRLFRFFFVTPRTRELFLKRPRNAEQLSSRNMTTNNHGFNSESCRAGA